jgi:hypothetical protein
MYVILETAVLFLVNGLSLGSVFRRVLCFSSFGIDYDSAAALVSGHAVARCTKIKDLDLCQLVYKDGIDIT